MRRPRSIITPSFLAGVRVTGALAEAATRVSDDLSRHAPLSRMSTWALVCEEVVDTEYEPAYYERVVAELFRRGITPAELEAMRVFAWETAGWLNFEKMLWDWVSLDEADVRRAIEWQHREGEIDAAERDRRLAYVARYEGGAHAGRAAGVAT